ncbi:plexin domain-containing protein 2-like [Diadema setosum]|uniref:plexin domain-containing protein 2-like n=1 Tax=Diadema setosum TaxID=31175 RepID=UPI003B3B76DA
MIAEVSVAEHHLEDGSGRYRRDARNDSMATPMPSAPGTPPPADTVIVEDGHSYYNSTYYSNGQHYFIDMVAVDERVVNVHTALSRTHLTAGEVSLPFQFPFYGHNLTKVYIATGGFLSLSTFFHQHLSATQYIAPLMGNFDPSLNDSSRIRYGYNDTSFTVEWDDIHVQHVQSVGRFTFQTTLMSDGRIIFAYGKVSADVDDIRGGNGHKVTVGLADGYYIDKPLYPGSLLIQRTIYHYHNVWLNETLVKGGAAFVLQPLPTCNLYKSCSECLEMRAAIQFDCGWCSKIGRCSSGFDRNRQDWLDADCPENAQEECHNPGKNSVTTEQINKIYRGSPTHLNNRFGNKQSSPYNAVRTALVIVFLILFVLVFIGCGFAIYAFKNPQSRSGQALIQFQHLVRRGMRRNPQDNYEESIVNNMQESKPSPPPAYDASEQEPTTPASQPAGAGAAGVTLDIKEPSEDGGAVAADVTGNGDAGMEAAAAAAKLESDPSAQTAEC